MSIDIQRDYYINANILPPRHFSKRSFEPKIVEFEIPESVTKRPDENFKFLKQDARMEFGYWECYKPNDKTLCPEVVVARNPKYPNQRIIAPEKAIPELMFAYHLLDGFYPKNQFRNMDVVVGAIKDPKSRKKFPYTVPDNGHLYSENLLEISGISTLLKETNFNRPKTGVPRVGIYCDIPWPVFFVGWANKGLAYNSLYYASSIIHDYTHFEQKRLGLKVNTPESEVQAINNGHSFASYVSRSPIYSNAKTRDKYLIDMFLKRGDRLVKNFTNGGIGHLLKKNVNKIGNTSELANKKDFEYGKPLSFAIT